MYNALGISYGELALKGKNRGNFERILNTRIRNILKGTDYKLILDSSKLYILSDEENIDEIIRKIKKIFGIVLISPSVRVENDETEIKNAVLKIAEKAYDNGARNFKVTVKRSNKKFQKIRFCELSYANSQKKIKKTSTSQETEEKVFTLIKLQKTGYYYQRKPRHTGNNTFEARFIWR